MPTPAEEMALLGLMKHTPTILGKKFVFEPLDSDQEVMAIQMAETFSGKARENVLKIEKMARSIKMIDGVPFSLTEAETKEGMSPLAKARQVVFKWAPPVRERVYAEYVKMEELREAAIAQIEKNVQSPIPSTGAGR